MTRLDMLKKNDIPTRVTAINKTIIERKNSQYTGTGSMLFGYAYDDFYAWEGYLPASGSTYSIKIRYGTVDYNSNIVYASPGYSMIVDHAATAYRPYDRALEKAAGRTDFITVTIEDGPNSPTGANYHWFIYTITGPSNRYIQFLPMFDCTVVG